MGDSPLDQFEKFVEHRGMRLTRARRAVASFIFTLTSPFAVEEIALVVCRPTSRVRASRSTLYRLVALLREAGLVTEKALADGSSIYIPNFEPQSDIASRCAEAHGKLIAGTCPWCGRAIVPEENHPAG